MHPAKALCILGPTGAGKTEAALALADAVRGVVVNFDSRQVYREIPVTTAQPTPEEQTRCGHMLYGFLSCSRAISAGAYAELAAPVIRDVLAQEMVPILVGGTGLYLKALLEGMAPIPDVPGEVRQKVLDDWDFHGPLAMHERLALSDPAYATKVHPNDRQRVTRALEVFDATGRTFSQWHAATEKVLDVPCLKMGIGLDKGVLEKRLARRIEAMLEAGALEEIRRAVELCPEPNAPGLSGIGCAELAAHLRGETSLDEAKALWLSNTKAYAKRQMTWFKKDPDIRWFSPGEAGAMLTTAQKWLHTP
ncbi:MAG: tRNA (adenosine(37)-N6)-dimethylallyltransferase MiaA [Desulfovibrio sp.]|nr:tRNA (adenosine(37)-N6)-dimethylallyltransferase MiaA [Desulfovibrio sp.]MBI4959920.1 tRNA (adenosine(37)-N6)-dimethylallyltransferase MiaA [Desulfovibrio sp.]